jgi:TolB-like protein/cytochrome c-type biogenesis protein CcmH/NrfG
MSDSGKAVFLSYASQDAEAARRICEALRASGIEVWFDQSELRGGDAWDQKIRHQIQECALFVPIISANTDARTEGYFRLEWKLAVDRSHLMADDAAFLFPIVIDETTDQAARVPDKFRSVQWTRVPGGATPAGFCERVGALLAGTAKVAHVGVAPHPAAPDRPRRQPMIITGVVLLAVAAAVLSWWALRRAAPPVAAVQKAAAPAPVNIPPHSVAVLPFADLSQRKDQEYFSDGLAEELLNLLSKVPGLQVAARTSAFSFKGGAVDVPTIGRKLRVANVLEGSVRKSGNHLRITAQLVRADNGYEVWSEVYDREIGEVFRVQDEIAGAVVKALKLTLLGNATPHAAATGSSDAYLLFLKGRAKMSSEQLADFHSAANDFAQVIKLDPNYAPAYVELATAKTQIAEFEITADRPAAFAAARGEANVLLERALALDPRNAQAYVERGYLRAFSDLKGAEQDYRRALELDPNSARAYEGLALVIDGDPDRQDEVPRLFDKAQQLDPLTPRYGTEKAKFLLYRRSRVQEAETLLRSIVAGDPRYMPALALLAEACTLQGKFADGALYGEQVLKLDPLNNWTRRLLMRGYIAMDDLVAARQLADEAPYRLPIEQLAILVREGNWHRAAEVYYRALADQTALVLDTPLGELALRMDARATGNYRRAQSTFEQLSGVTWAPGGLPILPSHGGLATSVVSLGDMLIAGGDRARGERLLRASLADMNHVASDLGNGEFWYLADRAVALALLGDRDALSATILAARDGYQADLFVWTNQSEPAFKAFQGNADFRAAVATANTRSQGERQALARLRAEGRVPMRGPAPGKK